jgi:hypothetical protein
VASASKSSTPGLGGDGGGGQSVVAGDHHRFDAHAPQFGEALLDAALHDVLEFDHAQHVRAIGHHQRGAAAPGHRVDSGAHVRREMAALRLDVGADGVRRAFANLPVLQIDAAHPGLGRKVNEGRAEGVDVALAQVELLFGEHHDGTAFRRFVGQRR